MSGICLGVFDREEPAPNPPEARRRASFLEARLRLGGAHKKEERALYFTDQARPSFTTNSSLPSSWSPRLLQYWPPIERHQHAISHNERYRKRCLRCDATQGFAKHELRRRKVRVIVALTVQVVSVVVIRWKCTRCRYVFTDLPDFRTPLPTLCQPEPAPLGPRIRGAGHAFPPAGRCAPRPSDRLCDATPASHGLTNGLCIAPRCGGSWPFSARRSRRSSPDCSCGVSRNRSPHCIGFWGPSPRINTAARHAENVCAQPAVCCSLIDRWDRTFHEPFFPRFATRSRGP